MTYQNISSQYQNYRRIALIVIHCSATRCDRDFPVEALRHAHVHGRNFADIGYHSTSPAMVSFTAAVRWTTSAHMPADGMTIASGCAMKADWTNTAARRIPAPSIRKLRSLPCCAN